MPHQYSSNTFNVTRNIPNNNANNGNINNNNKESKYQNQNRKINGFQKNTPHNPNKINLILESILRTLFIYLSP